MNLFILPEITFKRHSRTGNGQRCLYLRSPGLSTGGRKIRRSSIFQT